MRLSSALVLLSFVICHLTAHCLLLVSFEDAEATRNVLMYPWRTLIGTVVLVAAFLVHFGNALWSIYIRRSLRLTRWEWTQLALGLTIPALLMFHVMATRIAEELLDVTTYYSTVFIVQWLMFPWLGAIQMLAVIIGMDARQHRHSLLAAHQTLVPGPGGRCYSASRCCCRPWRWPVTSPAAIRFCARRRAIPISSPLRWAIPT